MDKIRWGVLSTAKIGREKVIPATQRSQSGVVTAIASRDLARAATVAAELGIEKAYGSYQAVARPIATSTPFTFRCPTICTSAGRSGRWRWASTCCARSRSACRWPRRSNWPASAATQPEAQGDGSVHVPLPSAVADGAAAGAARAGSASLRTIHTDLLVLQRRPAEHPQPARHRRRGADGHRLLPDLPVAIHFRRRAAARVLGQIERDPATQIDRLTSGVLEFFQGTATFTCATQLVPYQRVNIFGTSRPDRNRDPVQRAARSAVPHLGAHRHQAGHTDRRNSLRRVRSIHAAGRRLRAGRSSTTRRCRRRWPTRWPTCG